MIAPQIPENEVQRLECLNSLKILDTEEEERFDRLTRMAKRLFDVPIALVSLVDAERQWFKSRQGLDATETSRDISFCGHAILGDDIFLVADAALDERFADNPLVTNDPKIRFYAGAPLTGIDGSRLGTLCLIDRVPRKFSREDAEALSDLAAMAERELKAVQLATLDELTGLSNRRGFMTLANRLLSFINRQSLSAAMVFLDLNDFKQINDEYGHAEGDQVLIQFSGFIRQVFRDSDVFGRIGGDEFVIIISDANKLKARKAINRLREVVNQFNESAGNPYLISFAFGIVEYDGDKHDSLETLMAESDALMYENKSLQKS